LAFAGCSRDDSGGDDGSSGGASGSAAPSVPTKAKVREVTGRLSQHRRHAVLADVTSVVDGWWDAAYLTPGAGDHLFPGFTHGAAKLATRDRQIMTAAAYPDGATDPVAVRRAVLVDILAVRGRAVGVTAKVALGVRTSGDTDRVVAVRGLLQLSHEDGGWRVFGYDVTATPRVVGAGKHRKARS
jgi:hypothetical protein